MIKRAPFFFLSLLFLIYTNSYAATLKSNHPDQYVVQKGDTLWAIASKFLYKPWEWKEIWRSNPSIHNPDKIYPGDVLALRQVNGQQPYLQVVKDGMVKLSPRVREEPIDNAIPTIPLNAIKPFLNNSQVMPDDRLSNAPYVVAYAENHLLAGPGDRIYISELNDASRQTYTILRPDLIYIDPVTDEQLGYLALYVGEADMVNPGKPATVKINSIKEGVEIGDHIVALMNAAQPTIAKIDSIIEEGETGNHVITIWEDEFTPYFEPQPPTEDIEGLIIDMFGGITQIASNQVVVINKGRQDKLEIGNVLTINKIGSLIRDPLNRKEKIQLPNDAIGEIMVFRVFERVSFALIMRALEPVRKLYLVTNP